MHRKILSLSILLLLACVFVEISRRTGSIGSDSWQSAGPAALSQYPFDLKGAYLGDFDHYDHKWGHHWPGWPALISVITSTVGFHAVVVFSICILFNILAGYAAYKGLKSFWGANAAFCVMLAVALIPDLNVAASFMRPECLVSLLATILQVILVGRKNCRSSALFVIPLCFGLVFTHVLGPVIVVGFLLAELLTNPSRFKQELCSFKWSNVKSLAFGLSLGMGMLGFWFLADDARSHHFFQNIEAQKSSYHSLLNSAKLCFFSDLNGLFVLALFATMLTLYLYLIVTRSKMALKHYAVVPLVCLLFSIITHNPNRSHLACVLPCVLFLLAAFLHDRAKWCRILYVGVVVIFSAFHLKRVAVVLNQPDDDIRKEMRSFLSRNHTSDLRLIPPSLWETAAEMRMKNVRLYTFPNVALLPYQVECEKHLWTDVKNGDVLIFDETSTSYSSDYFHDDVLARLRIVDPKQVGEVLQQVEIRGLSQTKNYSVIRITNERYIREALETN